MVRAGIRRQRLIDRLDAATRQPVTLVCAGAGWGKTMLLSDWMESTSVPVGWLSLNSQDNDPQAFWSHVVATLRATGQVRGDSPLAELSSIPADDVERIVLLESGLSTMPTATVLVLDEAQEIEDPRIVRELAVLLRHPARALRLVLSSRTEPAVPLPHARDAGTLAEIGTADLAFTMAETTRLLAGHGLDLPADDVRTLLDRTRGWAAGLQLAVAFLTGGHGPPRVEDFTGDLRAVDGYLADEVLARDPPEVRRFLLETSVCDRVCGDLADAITAGTGGQRTLEELERVNDFVVRLGSEPHWFRYHPLLHDALRHRLLRENPVVVPELHRRAAAWYAAHDSTFEALDHAVAARDWPYVGRLVVAHAAPQIVSANRAALVDVLERVPPAALSDTAELMTCAALRLFHAGDYNAIPECLAGARELLATRPAAERPAVEVTLQSLQIAVSRARADMPALMADSTRLLAMVDKVGVAELPSMLQHRAIALSNNGVALLWTGRLDLAVRYLWEAVTAARAEGMELPEINALGHLALLEVICGSGRAAADLAGRARDLAHRRGWWSSLQVVPAHLAQALVEIEGDDLAAAQSALQQALVSHRADPEAAQRKVWLGVRARLVLAQGDPATAEALLEEAQRPADPAVRAPGLDRWLLLVQSEVDLAIGRPDRVRQRYGSPAQQGQLSYPERVCLARAAFAEHDLPRADTLLADAHSTLRHAVARVEGLILAALIADATGNDAGSADAFAAAVALAEPEGVRRPFVSMADGRLTAFLDRHGSMTMEIRTTAGHPPLPGGALSARETEVLRYLPTMLTAGEIAGYLTVSVNTVKAHMRSIYRKLDAGRRHEAVDRARQLGLI